ncbi:MAG: tRNA pseudouridine(55) synthase TruB, partial [Planctomycetota bacterium]
AGHAGTLDPAATGVLVIALGEATKVVPYVTDAMKAYRFTVRFGAETTTDDAEGDVTRRCTDRPADAEIAAALAQFRGQISQVPPQVSAVKVAGARAYDLAREGETLELEARSLWVESLEMLERIDPDSAVFEMVCGKGGYVRSVARDLGRVLGCLGHVESLRRLWSGPFDQADAITVEDVERLARTEALDQLLLPLEQGLTGLPELPCTAEGAARLSNGNPGDVLRGDLDYGAEAWASHASRAIAVGHYRGGQLHPKRVFRQ